MFRKTWKEELKQKRLKSLVVSLGGNVNALMGKMDMIASKIFLYRSIYTCKNQLCGTCADVQTIMVNSSKYILKRDSRYTCVAVILWHFDLPRNCVILNCVRASDGSAIMECHVPYYYHYLCAFVDGTALFDLFFVDVIFFYMLFLLGGLFKRTFHVEKNAEEKTSSLSRWGKKRAVVLKTTEIDWGWRVEMNKKGLLGSFQWT